MDDKEFFQDLYTMTNKAIDQVLENLPPIEALLQLDFTDPKKIYYALSWDIETATIVYNSLHKIKCPLTVTEYIEAMLIRAKIYVEDITKLAESIKGTIREASNYINSPQKFSEIMSAYQDDMDKMIFLKSKLHEYSKALNPNYIKSPDYIV